MGKLQSFYVLKIDRQFPFLNRGGCYPRKDNFPFSAISTSSDSEISVLSAAIVIGTNRSTIRTSNIGKFFVAINQGIAAYT